MDLGTSVVIKGELSGSEDFTLSGQMEGSIRLSDHTLTVGPHADIRAVIVAKAVVILVRSQAMSRRPRTSTFVPRVR